MVAYGSRTTEGLFWWEVRKHLLRTRLLQGHKDDILARHEILLRREGTRDEAQSSQGFLFRAWISGTVLPLPCGNMCWGCRSNPWISTFRDKTPTLLGRKVSLHLFIGIIAYFAFWMGIATSWFYFSSLPLCVVHFQSVFNIFSPSCTPKSFVFYRTGYGSALIWYNFNDHCSP